MLKNDFFTYEISTQKWAKISKVLSTTNTLMRLWDGSKYPLVQVSSDIVPRFSSLIYKSATNKIIIFGGIGKNSKSEYYPFKDVWNYEINLTASTAVISKQETSFELFSKHISDAKFCWALDPTKEKWFIQKQSISAKTIT